MPNPFPGMNPYLENPRRWRDVHNSLIYCFRAALSAALPSGFAAQIEERVYVQEASKEYVADALVIETVGPPVVHERYEPYESNGSVSSGTWSGTATLARPTQNKVLPASDTPRKIAFSRLTERETFIEIRTGHDWEDIVLVIEILSPTNKTPGTGYNQYQHKQNDLLNSNAHLLEIDLLRAGVFSLAPPELDLKQRLARFDYLTSLHYAGTGAEFDLWPRTVRDRLPRLLLPLTGEEKVVVDLQAVLERAYHDGDYDRIVDYTQPPQPPLSPGDALWANDLITQMNSDAKGVTKTEADEASDEVAELETKDF